MCPSQRKIRIYIFTFEKLLLKSLLNYLIESMISSVLLPHPLFLLYVFNSLIFRHLLFLLLIHLCSSMSLFSNSLLVLIIFLIMIIIIIIIIKIIITMLFLLDLLASFEGKLPISHIAYIILLHCRIKHPFPPRVSNFSISLCTLSRPGTQYSTNMSR